MVTRGKELGVDNTKPFLGGCELKRQRSFRARGLQQAGREGGHSTIRSLLSVIRNMSMILQTSLLAC